MFRTEFNLTEPNFKLDLKAPIITIGSCFSDCMGQRFLENKFDTLSNPFGTVYNPISIVDLLTLALKNQKPSDNTYTENQGLWSNYLFHSSFSSSDPELARQNVQTAIKKTHEYLSKSKILIITLGTAFVYKRKDNDEIVANCHKIPQKHFTKSLLTQNQILSEFEPVISKLNNDVKIILTVSPVRHLKDTIEQNSVSKSILRVACDTLANNFSQVSYFPSYEIMMDDLRDYRFYKRDMIHPSEEAEDYIWKKFSEVYFSEETIQFLEDWTQIRNALKHRPFNPTSDKHQQFIKNNIKKLEELSSQADVQKEISIFKKQLI